jgi:hypothetical protein
VERIKGHAPSPRYIASLVSDFEQLCCFFTKLEHSLFLTCRSEKLKSRLDIVAFKRVAASVTMGSGGHTALRRRLAHMARLIEIDGPDQTLTRCSDAAPGLQQTSQCCIEKHFRDASGSKADKTVVGRQA